MLCGVTRLASADLRTQIYADFAIFVLSSTSLKNIQITDYRRLVPYPQYVTT